jgi:hypothetical protein
MFDCNQNWHGLINFKKNTNNYHKIPSGGGLSFPSRRGGRTDTKKLIVCFLNYFVKAPKNELSSTFLVQSYVSKLNRSEAEDKEHGQIYKTSALCINFMYFIQKRHKKLQPKCVCYVIYSEKVVAS